MPEAAAYTYGTAHGPGQVTSSTAYRPADPSLAVTTTEWSVNETEIQDRYQIVVNTTYETDLAIASLIFTPASVSLPLMRFGDVVQGEVCVRNVGLIRAQDIRMPSIQGAKRRIEWLSSIPSSLEAGETICLAYRATRIGEPDADDPINLPAGGSGGNGGNGGDGGAAGASGGGGGGGAGCGPGESICAPAAFSYTCSNDKDFSGQAYACFASSGTPCPGGSGSTSGPGSASEYTSGGSSGPIVNTPGGSSPAGPVSPDACFPANTPPVCPDGSAPPGPPPPPPANPQHPQRSEPCGSAGPPPAPSPGKDRQEGECGEEEPANEPDPIPAPCPAGGGSPGASPSSPPGGPCGAGGSGSGQGSGGGSWVDLIYREYQTAESDLSVPGLYGPAILSRDYYGQRWRFNFERTLYRVDLDGGAPHMVRNRVPFAPVAGMPGVYAAGLQQIKTLPGGGLKWLTSGGIWETYSSSGRILASGRGLQTFQTFLYPAGTVFAAETVLLARGAAEPGFSAPLPAAIGNDAGLPVIALTWLADRVQSASTSIAGLAAADQKAVSFTWNAALRLAAVTSPAGLTGEYGYDADGRLTRHRMPSAREKIVAYHAVGGVSRVSGWDGGDRTFSYQFDDIRREYYAIVSFAGGGIIERWFDAAHTEIRRRENGEESLAVADITGPLEPYAGSSLRVAYGTVVTDTQTSLSKETRYDRYGQPVYKKNREGREFAQQLMGPENSFRPQWKRSFNGFLRTWQYDAQGRVTRRCDSTTPVTLENAAACYHAAQTPAPADFHTETYTYYGPEAPELDGLLKTRTDREGRVWTYYYTTSTDAPQPAGRLRRTIAADQPGDLSDTTFDAFGRTIARTDALGRITTYTFDAQDRILTMTNPPGEQTVNTYTGAFLTSVETGRKVNVGTGAIESYGRVMEYGYDEKERPVKTWRRPSPTGARQLVQAVAYDADGRVLTTTNALGHTTTSEYDTEGRLVKTIAPGPVAPGRVTIYQYDSAGRMESTTDPAGTVTAYEYDAAGRQSATIHGYGTPLARRTESVYDAATGMLMETRYPNADANGTMGVTGTLYNDRQEAIGSTGNMSSPGSSTFDQQGRLLTTTDARGAVTTYEYIRLATGEQRITHYPVVVAGQDDFTLQETDLAGQTIASRNVDGVWTQTFYDAAGRAVASSLPSATRRTGAWWTDSAAVASLSTYNAHGEILTSNVAGAGTISVAYDAFGRQTAVTPPIGYPSYTEYDLLDRAVISRTPAVVQPDPLPLSGPLYLVETTTFHPDDPTLSIASSDVHGNTSTTLYDAAGRVTESIASNGVRSVTAARDALGRPTLTEIHPSAADLAAGVPVRSTAILAYDRFDHIISTRLPEHTDAAPAIQTRTYDIQGRTLTISGAGTYPLSYAYDTAAGITSMTDGNGATTTWQTDPRGRLIRKTFADGSHQDQTYDGANRLLTRADPRGNVLTTTGYNAFGQPLGLTRPHDPAAVRTFDAFGRAHTISDATGATTYLYDAYGRVLTETKPALGRELRYSYLTTGQLTSVAVWNTITNPPALERTMTYGYDAPGRLTALTDSAVNPSVPFLFQWDEEGTAIARRIMPHGIIQDTMRNSLDQVTKQTGYGSTPDPVMDLRYTYDPAGQRRTLTNVTTPTASRTYTYDAAHQVRTVSPATPGATPLESFTWDALGNRLASTIHGIAAAYVPNSLNQYTTIDGAAQSHDPAGNTTTLRGPGGPAAHDVLLYYDDDNRLVRAENLLNNHATEFTYNEANQRIEERRYATLTDAQPVETIRTLYLGWSPIAFYRAPGPGGGTRSTNTAPRNELSLLPASAFTLQTTQTWGPDIHSSLTATGGVGALLATTSPGPGPGVSGTTILYYLHDPLGNIQSILESTGTERARYTYDAFGSLQTATGDLAATNPWRFSTKEAELWPTGFAYYGHRFYDPVEGRWVNRDPSGEEGGTNLYGMVANSPLSAADYLGTWKIRGAGALHENMSEFAFNMLSCKKCLDDPEEFVNELREGARYPDVPEGYGGLLMVDRMVKIG